MCSCKKVVSLSLKLLVKWNEVDSLHTKSSLHSGGNMIFLNENGMTYWTPFESFEQYQWNIFKWAIFKKCLKMKENSSLFVAYEWFVSYYFFLISHKKLPFHIKVIFLQSNNTHLCYFKPLYKSNQTDYTVKIVIISINCNKLFTNGSWLHFQMQFIKNCFNVLTSYDWLIHSIYWLFPKWLNIKLKISSIET